MSAGSALIKVLLVVMNLAIVGVLAVSVYGIAGTTPEFDFDPDNVVFTFDEDEISIYAPFSLSFSGYWDIEDFYYSYYIMDDAENIIAEGGQGPMTLRKDVTNHITISESITITEILAFVDEDIILEGINLTMGVEVGGSYLSSLLSLSFAFDLEIPIDPIIEDFEVDDGSVIYVGDTLEFTVNHNISSMFQELSLPLGVEIYNDSASIGFGVTDMNFSDSNTTFTVEVNQTELEDAVLSGDMLYLRFGLMTSATEFGPSFSQEFFQLNGFGITDAAYDNVSGAAELSIYLDTFSAVGGTVSINATISNGTASMDSDANLNLDLDSNATGNLTFTITYADFIMDYGSSGFDLQMRVYLFGGTVPVVLETEYTI